MTSISAVWEDPRYIRAVVIWRSRKQPGGRVHPPLPTTRGDTLTGCVLPDKQEPLGSRQMIDSGGLAQAASQRIRWMVSSEEQDPTVVDTGLLVTEYHRTLP
ncbi:hypothetical protein N7510_010279 [Penicillium lagena]|uniref:uncharacterized protein n=1 Tax=Penicillium lagena TaxID=94218 RepID=UPI0025410FC4|nr:uncharacterized protein N7510_010279 [Penicillium lagena]KAJ5605125.1 hypothetical protein N7510_010279 [Penicillium lagena]